MSGHSHPREETIEGVLRDCPKIDLHTHLSPGRLMARGLDDILLYHMVNSELYAAGCPIGSRVPENRTPEEAERRLEAAVPYVEQIRNTSLYALVKGILEDLYEWRDGITVHNWRALDRHIREMNADDGGRARRVLNALNIRKTGTEITRRAGGIADDLFDYALEWAFFARVQWGQPDIALFELERAWNAEGPQEPIPVTMRREDRPRLQKTVRTVAELEEAVRHYCARIPYDRINAIAQHISTDLDYGRYGPAAVQAALDRRSQAGAQEQNVYSSAVLQAFFEELQTRSDRITFQFSIGAEALPFESGARLRQQTIGHLAEMVAAFPRLRFMCFNASRHGHQSLCTLVRELPNLSLAGFWWHGFFPGALRQMAEERLDMLPLNRQSDYMTDAYCVDWVYGKNRLILQQYTRLFAEKVARGQYSLEDVRAIARAIFFDTPRALLGFSVDTVPPSG